MSSCGWGWRQLRRSWNPKATVLVCGVRPSRAQQPSSPATFCARSPAKSLMSPSNGSPAAPPALEFPFDLRSSRFAISPPRECLFTSAATRHWREMLRRHKIHSSPSLHSMRFMVTSVLSQSYFRVVGEPRLIPSAVFRFNRMSQGIPRLCCGFAACCATRSGISGQRFPAISQGPSYLLHPVGI